MGGWVKTKLYTTSVNVVKNNMFRRTPLISTFEWASRVGRSKDIEPQ